MVCNETIGLGLMLIGTMGIAGVICLLIGICLGITIGYMFSKDWDEIKRVKRRSKTRK